MAWVCGVLAALLSSSAFASSAESPAPPDDLTRLGLSKVELEKVRAGAVVARILPQVEDNFAFVLGLVFIQAPPKALLDGIRSVGTFRAGARVLQAGRFSSPPAPGDLDLLTFEPLDFQDLRKCRVGDCDIRVAADTMAVAKGLDWNAPSASQKASQALKSALLAQLGAYIGRGNDALPAYHEAYAPDESGREMTRLLEGLPESPSLLRHIQQYPTDRLSGVEDFFCWSKQVLRRPVVSLVHVSLHTASTDGNPHYVVAFKHVYDSHYFIAYAEFLNLIPVPKPARGFFLVQSIYAKIDPPHSLRGLLLAKIKREMCNALRSDLDRTRSRLEHAP